MRLERSDLPHVQFRAFTTHTRGRTAQMIRILVVDDSTTIRKMVKASLQGLPAEFTEAASGLEAIEQLAITRVSLLVLDLNMPDMHGLEVLRFVRRHAAFSLLPIIVLTTRGDENTRESAMAAGARA